MNFSQSELNYMREQAVKKAFEMQKRSKPVLEESPGEVIFEKSPGSSAPKNDYVETVLRNSSRAELIKAKVPFSEEKNGNKNVQSAANYDDRLIILALIIVLAENNADRLLILALLYIMM